MLYDVKDREVMVVEGEEVGAVVTWVDHRHWDYINIAIIYQLPRSDQPLSPFIYTSFQGNPQKTRWIMVVVVTEVGLFISPDLHKEISLQKNWSHSYRYSMVHEKEGGWTKQVDDVR